MLCLCVCAAERVLHFAAGRMQHFAHQIVRLALCLVRNALVAFFQIGVNVLLPCAARIKRRQNFVALRSQIFLITLNVRDAGRIVRVGKRADHAVRPVEVLSRRHGARIRQIIRRGCHIRIERNRLVERVGTDRNPFHAHQLFGHIRPQLGDGHKTVAG